ncbi:bifunctional diguanylate cyclase/phosphodiesterase [Oscillatoria salina]|uniref:bifunctional diguanylate cyclase/phosphodiesterase n=1 Tax=Oscillatoria salina TaxID=331517 RepID=UPI0013B9DCA3|nr:EAL domain-containing protein [Oscillatoria salina]MBZ8180758.1 EAL domain-containing protein [Oscillatoria salina IIICB1]NET88256.1 EAL domain-containing protein [Kamptonema sp. SIO1D9]
MNFSDRLPQALGLNASKQAALGLIILMAAGFAGNYLRWSFFFHIDFIFGTIAVWLVVCLYGKSWGIVAALIASSCTYLLWLHPYAIVIFTCEAIFVSYLFHRRKQNILLLDGIYWLIIGMPLIWFFYAHVLQVEPIQARIILLKQPVNGIFNALIASLMLNYLPIHKCLDRPPKLSNLSLRQTLFNLLVAFVFFPTLGFMAWDSHRVVDNIKTSAQQELNAVSTQLINEIETWQQKHLQALRKLAEISPLSFRERLLTWQANIQITKAILPDFENIYLVDSAGKIRVSTSAIQTNFPKKINLSSAQISITESKNLSEKRLILTVATDQQKRNFIIGEINLNTLEKILKLNTNEQGREITLVDPNQRVIASTRSNLQRQQTFARRQDGEIQPLKAQSSYHWLPTTGSPIFMVRWTNSFFVRESLIANEIPWTLIVEVPAAPHVRYIEQVYTKDLLVLIVISSLALIIAELISRRLVAPLYQLAKVTTNLPHKLLERELIRWPQSQITELASLVDNFRLMSVALAQKFREIHAAKILLEQRVADRTQELLATNRELEAEIRERQQVEAALRESEERFRQMAENINEVFWMKDRDRYTNLYTSPAYETIWGRSCASLYRDPTSYLDAIHPEDREQVVKALKKKSIGDYNEEYRIIKPDGSVRWIWDRAFPIANSKGEVYRIVGVARDITDRKLAEAQLLRNAFYDPLTELPNRSLFMDRLKQAIARTQRELKRRFAVLFLDLDRFKIVNDSLGHLVGDRLLIETAQRLQTCLRPGDTVARFGGDEFAILLDDVKDVGKAILVCERIQKALESPFFLDSYEVFTTASIGIALSTKNDRQPENLLRDADTAMYRAKAKGKGHYAIFDPTMYNQVVELLRVETDLRKAIERQELQVYYQPVICLKTGKIIGFEALVRWQHSQQGLISPAAFIPIAEETGLIVSIGQWVLEASCRQLLEWQEKFSFSRDLIMSVNLSPKQFCQRSLVAEIDKIMQKTRINAKNLKLEITESGIVENADSAAQILAHLKNLGVQLCIDDFGTGYSSLSRLHQFPIDTLKIDRSFVSRMERESEGIKIVQAIVTLAHNLGMDAIAEGIETQMQLEQLKALQCEQGQGYFFAKPLDNKAAEELLAKSPQW